MNFFLLGELSAEFGSVVFIFFTILIHFLQKSHFGDAEPVCRKVKEGGNQNVEP